MASHISPSKMETKASSSTAQDFIDYGDVCRICGSDENSLNLIGIYSNEGLGDDLPTKINTYLPVTVASTDDLPLQCCTKCVSTLNSWHVFVNNSVEADSKWKNFHVLASSSNKLLNEEEGDDGIGDRDDDQSELDDDMPLSELVETKQEPEDDDDEVLPPTSSQIIKDGPEETLDEAFTCNICGSHFRNALVLKGHMFAKHGIWIKASKSAPKTTSVPPKPPKRIVKKRRPAGSKDICKICGYCTKKSKNFKDHMMTHTKERPFLCQTCGAAFARKVNLKGHERTHGSLEERLPHQCHICHKRVSTAYVLSQHILTHSEDKNHQCDQCGMTFKLKATMKVHKNLIHNENTKKPCEICGKICVGTSRLTRHMMTHSDAKYVCTICDKRFTAPDLLNEHKLIHVAHERTHECQICHKKFMQRRHLGNHLRVTHNIRTRVRASTSRN